MKEKKLKCLRNKAEIYYQLKTRQDNMIKNIDDHLDVMANFTKKESQAYLKHRQEGGGFYETNLIRYSKDSHKKHATERRTNTKSAYMIHIDKILNNLIP